MARHRNDADALSRRLLRAQAHLPLMRLLCRDPSMPDEEVIRRIAMITRLGEFFTALSAYAEAYEACTSAPRTASRPIRFTYMQTTRWGGCGQECAAHWQYSLSAGSGSFADWAHGSTAAILGAVATPRLATMAPTVPIAVAATLIFSLSTTPTFVNVDVLLSIAHGFAMFALAVAPMLFLCALLLGKTGAVPLYCDRGGRAAKLERALPTCRPA
jgi:hypothetical protein